MKAVQMRNQLLVQFFVEQHEIGRMVLAVRADCIQQVPEGAALIEPRPRGMAMRRRITGIGRPAGGLVHLQCVDPQGLGLVDHVQEKRPGSRGGGTKLVAVASPVARRTGLIQFILLRFSALRIDHVAIKVLLG